MVDIKVGDKVYYRYRIGISPRTFTGVVKSIVGDKAEVGTHYGAPNFINLNVLIKNQKQ